MEQIELFSIDKFKCNSEAKYYLIIDGGMASSRFK